MSTALYRRYRPQTFAEVIGQEHVTEPLKAALRSGRVNHAYLFSGPRGCGKTTSARILARCLNCVQGPTDTPCGECDSCRELATGGTGSIDVVEIDAASHNGVEDARSLRERAAFAPARDRFKIFILDEAHMVTPQGFNALLKLVEEPPAHVKFVFATTEPDKVLGTIKSRTHHYPFRLVPPEAMQKYMVHLCEAENIEVGEGVLPLVVRAGGGSVRDSLSVLDQLMAGAADGVISYDRAVALLGYTDASLLDEIVGALAGRDGAGAYQIIERMIESGHDPRRFVEDLLQRLRDLVIIAVAGDATEGIFGSMPADQVERMVLQARAWGAPGVSRAADLTAEALTNMTGATSPRLLLELLIARILVVPVAPASSGSGNAEAASEGDSVASGGSAKAKLMAELKARREASAKSSKQTVSAQPAPVQPESAQPETKHSEPAPVESAQLQPIVPLQPVAAVPEMKEPSAPQPAQAQAEPKAETPVQAEPKAETPVQAEPKAETPVQPETSSPSLMVRDRWNEVVGLVKRNSRAAWVFISNNAHPGPVYNGVLYLLVPTEGLANPVRRYGNEISQALYEALGLKLQVEGVTDNQLKRLMSELKAAPETTSADERQGKSEEPAAPQPPENRAPEQTSNSNQNAGSAPARNSERSQAAPFDDGWGPVAIPGALSDNAVHTEQAEQEQPIPEIHSTEPVQPETSTDQAVPAVEILPAPSEPEEEENYSPDDFVEFDDDLEGYGEYGFGDDENAPSIYDEDYHEEGPIAGVEIAAKVLNATVIDQYIEDANGNRQESGRA